ncbi:MAG TPA: hypothetical protein VFV19_18785 [Candidatus Polarisedimenticolaceae bacterium]|nr:hypothetical protein [Candidatus Polarisedimenticolaceae bacterium]
MRATRQKEAAHAIDLDGETTTPEMAATYAEFLGEFMSALQKGKGLNRELELIGEFKDLCPKKWRSKFMDDAGLLVALWESRGQHPSPAGKNEHALKLVER